MTRKSRELYERVLARVLEVCHQHTRQRRTPSLLVSDYKLAILQAMTNTFTAARARGCWYHSGTVVASLLLYLAMSSEPFLMCFRLCTNKLAHLSSRFHIGRMLMLSC